MSYGVTVGGFNKKTYTEIIESLSEGYRQALGVNIDTGANSVIGQEIAVVGKALADLWENSASVYNAKTLTGATGAALEDIALQRNIRRRGATKSTVLLTIIANDGDTLTVPAGSKAKDTASTTVSWATVEDITLTIQQLSYTKIKITTATTTDYTVTITDSDGQTPRDYTVVGIATDTVESIASKLAIAINRDQSVTALATNDELELYARYSTGRFRITTGIYIESKQYGNTVWANATATGGIYVGAWNITTIETPVTKWQRVTNQWDTQAGAEIETDTILHQRIMNSFSTASGATPEAIRNRLLLITGVTNAIVSENTLGSYTPAAQPMPPHSISVLVEAESGHHQDIIDAIGSTRPAGIETCGEVVGLYTDQNGTQHTTKYTVPKFLRGYITVTITQQNRDEALPTNPAEILTDAIIKQSEQLQSGTDVAAQEFFKSVYSINGVGVAEIKIAKTDQTTPPPSTEWTAGVLNIEPYERVIFVPERVIINILQ